MRRTELPKSFDVEAETTVDPLEGLSRSRIVRIGAALVCGIGLAVSVFALLRASQGWPEQRADGEPSVVGTLAPSPPPLSVAPRAPTSPPDQAVVLPPAADTSTPRDVAPAPSASASVPSSANAPAERKPEQETAVTPAAPTSVASVPEPPAAKAFPIGPFTPLGPRPAPADAAEAAAPTPPPVVPRPRRDARATDAEKRAARERESATALRPIAVPGGSHPGVRAYSTAENAGRIGPDGVRRIIVRLP